MPGKKKRGFFSLFFSKKHSKVKEESKNVKVKDDKSSAAKKAAAKTNNAADKSHHKIVLRKTSSVKTNERLRAEASGKKRLKKSESRESRKDFNLKNAISNNASDSENKITLSAESSGISESSGDTEEKIIEYSKINYARKNESSKNLSNNTLESFTAKQPAPECLELQNGDAASDSDKLGKNDTKSMVDVNIHDIKPETLSLAAANAKLDESKKENEGFELEYSSIDMEEIFSGVQLLTEKFESKNTDSADTSQKAVTIESEARAESANSFPSADTSLSSLPNNSISSQNSNVIFSFQPQKAATLRSPKESPVNNPPVSSDSLSSSLRQLTKNDANKVPFQKVQEQNKKYGGLSPPHIRRNPNYSANGKTLYVITNNSVKSSRDVSWKEAVLINEHKKLKEMFDALQPSFYDKDMKPEARKIEVMINIKEFMKQFQLVNELAIEFKNSNSVPKLTSTYGTTKRRPALDKFSFQPLKTFEAERATASTVYESSLSNPNVKTLFQSLNKSEEKGTAGRNIFYNDAKNEESSKTAINKPEDKLFTKTTSSFTESTSTPKYLNKEKTVVLVGSPQTPIVASKSSSGYHVTASPKQPVKSTTSKIGSKSNNQKKKITNSPELQKLWVTNTVKFGSAAKIPDGKLLAYQKIRQEIEMEARRELELEKMRSRSSSQDACETEKSLKEHSNSPQSKLVISDDKNQWNKSSSASMTLGFTASSYQKPLENANNLSKSTKMVTNDKSNANDKAKQLSSKCSVTKDNNYTPEATYVYCSPIAMKNNSVRNIKPINESSFISSAISAKSRTSSEDNRLYMVKRTNQSYESDNKTENTSNVTRVCVNGSKNSNYPKVNAKISIEVTPASYSAKTIPETPQQKTQVNVRSSPLSRKSTSSDIQSNSLNLKKPISNEIFVGTVDKTIEKKLNQKHSANSLDVTSKTASLSRSKTRMAPSIPTINGTFELPSLRKVETPVERTGFELGTVLEDKQKLETSTVSSQRNINSEALALPSSASLQSN
uniref:DNA helicase n=1 Tax=Syphacia muris TaxID=451379 RepID=A0A158R4I0_9BILA